MEDLRGIGEYGAVGVWEKDEKVYAKCRRFANNFLTIRESTDHKLSPDYLQSAPARGFQCALVADSPLA
jgi:hypothetical protein